MPTAPAARPTEPPQATVASAATTEVFKLGVSCHLKVTDICKDDLIDVVEPLVVEIEDIREI